MNPFKILPNIVFFCFIILSHLNAQEGNPFISHFDLGNYYDKQIFAIEHDNDQVMFFATRKGIYTTDAEEKTLIKLPGIPLSMKLDPVSDIIYVGCRNNIGYIRKEVNGQHHYYSLLESGIFPDDYYMISQDSFHIYFAGESNIYRFKKNDPDEYFHYKQDSVVNFAGFFNYGNKTFINTRDHGIFEIVDSILVQQNYGNTFRNAEVLFSLPFSGGNIMIGTDENRLYRFNGKKFEPLKVRDQKYLDESLLSDGVEIDSTTIALSTLMGGCIILDKKTFKTIYIINIRTGLPDDEIFSIGKDLNHGIWLSHAYGLSRIDTRLPVMNYNSYPGIHGTIINAAVLNNHLYVSTNEGIYSLEEKRDYITREIIVKVKPEIKVESAKENEKEETLESTDVTNEAEPKLSKREIRKMKRQLKKEAEPAEKTNGTELSDENKPEEEATTEQSIIPEKRITSEETKSDEEKQALNEKQIIQEKQPVETKKRTILSIFRGSFKKPRNETELEEVQQENIYRKQKIYSLQSITHEFVKIPGLDKKADLLVSFNDRVLVGGTAGLYEIIDQKVSPVFPAWRVEFIEASRMPGRVFVGTESSTYLLEFQNGKWNIIHEFREIPIPVFSVCEDTPGNIWFGGDNVAHNVRYSDNSAKLLKSYSFTGEVYDPVITKYIHDTVYFFMSSNIYIFCNGVIKPKKINNYSQEFTPEYYFSDKGIVWIKNMNEWSGYYDSDVYDPRINAYLNLYQHIRHILMDNEQNLWVIDDNGRLDKIKAAKIPGYEYEFRLFVSSVTDQKNEFYNIHDLSFNYENRSIIFNVSAPFYLLQQSSLYQYYIEGLGPDWSSWSAKSDFSFPLLSPGKYNMHVRARNILGKLSNESVIGFIIRPPFWLSWWFLSLCGLFLIGLAFLIIRVRILTLQRDKRILEQKVWERTALIQRQKNEIETQKQEIMDSIVYAQRIQKAILPSNEKVQKILPENFILFLPRDIVSGDFYWMTRQNDNTVFAAVDCTGHGVPGAFMSMLGVSFLNEIVNKTSKLRANHILEELRTHVKTTLSQSNEGETKDGMDIALCILNHKTNRLQFSGAFNPLYLIRNNDLSEIKADRMPIGIYHDAESNFTNNEIQLQESDCLYIFSDGYVDQFGGKTGKKLLTKTLKEILLKIHSESMARQKELLLKKFQEWKGKYQQVDDILMIGIRIWNL
jgi:serine phosphatase RsbU (regulator of sigma subunit)